MKKSEREDIIITSTGFECIPDMGAMDDMELFEDIMRMNDPEATYHEKVNATERVFRALMGEKQLNALRKHLKAQDGKVKITAYRREQNEIFAKAAESKKK